MRESSPHSEVPQSLPFWPFALSFLTLGAAVFQALFMAQINVIRTFGLVFLGWLSWTFAEYLIHRFMEHPRKEHYILRVWSQHKEHHRDTQDWHLATHSLLEWIEIVAGIAAFDFIFLRNFMLMPPVIAGIVCGYLCYESIHFIAHFRTPQQRWLKTWVKHHLQHHEGFPRANYGISTSLWDHVFRTHVRLLPRLPKV